MTERISSIIDLFDKFETEEDCVRYIYELRTEDWLLRPQMYMITKLAEQQSARKWTLLRGHVDTVPPNMDTSAS